MLAVVYVALKATESTMGIAPVILYVLLIIEWIRDWTVKPHSRTALMPTVPKWGADLQQK